MGSHYEAARSKKKRLSDPPNRKQFIWSGVRRTVNNFFSTETRWQRLKDDEL
jgi:hypothetical protein